MRSFSLKHFSGKSTRSQSGWGGLSYSYSCCDRSRELLLLAADVGLNSTQQVATTRAKEASMARPIAPPNSFCNLQAFFPPETRL